jgi:hypothetical protein
VNAGLVELEGSWFVGNQVFSGGGAGGGARFRNTPVVGHRVLWRDNRSEGLGGGLHLELSSAGTFSYSTWIGNTAPDGASFSVSEGSLALDHSLLADPYGDAGACAGSTTSGSCLVGAPATGACADMPFVQRVAVATCEAVLDSLCPVPSPSGCGPVGHADFECGSCSTPVRPTTWGRLKDLYRR